jgi:uncharacterized protein
MAWLARRNDDEILALFEQSGRNAQRASALLREMIGEYPERAELARDVLLCEQEGDRIAHDIIYRRHESTGKRAPFESTNVYHLATALDDIVDYAEETADHLGLYAIEAPMEQAVTLADVLVAATEQVTEALGELRNGNELSVNLVEIHRLERGRPALARRRRLALRRRHRSDGGHPLEGHLRVPRAGRRRVRDRRAPARRDLSEAAPALSPR